MKHIKVELDFVPVKERLPGNELYDKRTLCFSPALSIHYRIIPAQDVRIMTDATYWAEIPILFEEASDES